MVFVGHVERWRYAAPAAPNYGAHNGVVSFIRGRRGNSGARHVPGTMQGGSDAPECVDSAHVAKRLRSAAADGITRRIGGRLLRVGSLASSRRLGPASLSYNRRADESRPPPRGLRPPRSAPAPSWRPPVGRLPLAPAGASQATHARFSWPSGRSGAGSAGSPRFGLRAGAVSCRLSVATRRGVLEQGPVAPGAHRRGIRGVLGGCRPQRDARAQLTLATTVEQFLLRMRMREGAQSLSLAERQRVVRLLIREVRIGKELVTICHSIPVGSASPAGSVTRLNRCPSICCWWRTRASAAPYTCIMLMVSKSTGSNSPRALR